MLKFFFVFKESGNLFQTLDTTSKDPFVRDWFFEEAGLIWENMF